MRTVRFRADGTVNSGTVDGDRITTDDTTYGIDDVEILPPTEPTKIVAVGKNYRDHVRAILGEVEKEEFPMLFFKPPSSIVGHGDDVIAPESSHFLDYEAELGVVIGERCSSVSEANALAYVDGYTCVNDVTARDWQYREEQWARAKGLDTFCPIGPFVQTDLQESLDITCRVNGEVRQSSNTDELLFSIPELVAEISDHFTLFPGDVIATGTPAGTSAETIPMEEWSDRAGEGALEPGDTVEVEIETVGTLENQVRSP
ncbi:fumarylacetoacetate hydrolase family protein [Natrarchaeobius oligotrophus]|uniref:2-hydroxyhepta-2,4-diene-1,7-dioate isomerase n=1 Tax=Natrarchaeobius chitinivorans TaxID=1679083 RepID=A0A3N6MEQ6_NATCH|nr:fumarylacetoacetate hydrolase family protein [Natrarchaeobius chitinivorans]RQH02389.1 2-hydroxyhepta-2,4-diene-1,7-dioate isomerase [Natrarchaeobius chitinivorans]